MNPDPHDERPGLRWRCTNELVPLAQLIGIGECTCWVGHCANHVIRSRRDEPEVEP